jgi:hypothetical protein
MVEDFVTEAYVYKDNVDISSCIMHLIAIKIPVSIKGLQYIINNYKCGIDAEVNNLEIYINSEDHKYKFSMYFDNDILYDLDTGKEV